MADRLAEQPATYESATGPRVFSAASFFEVIEKGTARRTGLGPDLLIERPATLAFYGFRGGAGRTLAVAHLAHMFVQRGLNVLAVDLDIEAPGLHSALGVDARSLGSGAVQLLQRALVLPTEELLPMVRAAMIGIDVPGASGKLILIPTGRLDERYLAQIEELALPLWHSHDPSPIVRLVDAARAESGADLVLLDCRTGFSGLAATVLFHLADMALIFIPLSEQVWDGLKMVLRAARAAKQQRGNRPVLLLVPSMIPPGDLGRRLTAEFLVRLRSVFEQEVGEIGDREEVADPWLPEGLRYDQHIAGVGRVVDAGVRAAWSIYEPLLQAVRTRADLGKPVRGSIAVDSAAVLREIRLPEAVADNAPLNDIQNQLVHPRDFTRSVDPGTALVLGAKGSGKTLLWRLLVGSPGVPRDAVVQGVPEGLRFVVGHPPISYGVDALVPSPDGFKQLERGAAMRRRSTYKAFWLVYALARLVRSGVVLQEAMLERTPPRFRRHWQGLLQARTPAEVIARMVDLLEVDGIDLEAESLILRVDELLVENMHERVCLAYDGLDTGFQTGRQAEWLERRTEFVRALLQVLVEWRPRLRRLVFKIFLREDIYLPVDVQNKSHLQPASHELQWLPEDHWRLALKITCTSDTYRQATRALLPGVDEPWLVSVDDLERLLFPFWGERLGRGKTAFSANYVKRRLSDAKGRLFPRTLVQLLSASIRFEQALASRSPEPDRVVSHGSLTTGVEEASQQRVRDLKDEYRELSLYLDALRGARALGTEKYFIDFMRKGIRSRGGLHYGARGWKKAIEHLVEVGVLGRREDQRLEVALLYRTGLGVTWTGLR